MFIFEEAARGVWSSALALALVLATNACGAYGSPGELGGPAATTETTVMVENHGIAAVAIYSSARRARLGTVLPGRSQCVELPRTGEVQHLLARPVGGGPVVASPDVRTPGVGWSWTIGTNPVVDGLSLKPRAQCSRAENE